MAEENKETGRQASAVPEAESRPYELKQVQVRLRLSEAGSIYSSQLERNHQRCTGSRGYVGCPRPDGSGICLCREPGHKKQAD